MVWFLCIEEMQRQITNVLAPEATVRVLPVSLCSLPEPKNASFYVCTRSPGSIGRPFPRIASPHHTTLQPPATTHAVINFRSANSNPYCLRYERMTRGRRREHYQWNMDIWGVTGVAAEAELLGAMVAFFERVGLGAEDVGIKVNSRGVLTEVLRSLGVPDDKHTATCVLVDKLDKVGRQMDGWVAESWEACSWKTCGVACFGGRGSFFLYG